MSWNHSGKVFALLSAMVASLAGIAAPVTTDEVKVVLETSAGAIEVEVFPRAAPISACDFLSYVDAQLYDGATFYRVVRPDNDRGQPNIEVIQGGVAQDAQPKPPVAHETTSQTGLRHKDGTLSLARGAVGTGSAAAFFIVIGEQPSLDFGGTRNPDRQGFAAFGRVVRGMDVVRRIQAMPADAPVEDAYVQGQILREPVVIERAKRVKDSKSNTGVTCSAAPATKK